MKVKKDRGYYLNILKSLFLLYLFTVDAPEQNFDFISIRDNFRQHIHNRRNSDVSDLVLLDSQMVQNLITLKQKSFQLLQNFKKGNKSSKKPGKVKTFSSFEEFLNFTTNQEEILNSELWKLEAICNYLDTLELDSQLTPF